jgi:hypothetical protein
LDRRGLPGTLTGTAFVRVMRHRDPEARVVLMAGIP